MKLRFRCVRTILADNGLMPSEGRGRQEFFGRVFGDDYRQTHGRRGYFISNFPASFAFRRLAAAF